LVVRVGLDANCVSYVIDAFAGVAEPSDSLAIEKKALFRSYIYLVSTFWVSPRAREECSAMPDVDKKLPHEQFFSCLFPIAYPSDPELVTNLTNAFSSYHSGLRDCRILAESISANLDVLLSFDGKFVRRLAPFSTPTKLMLPSAFWSAHHPPTGARPLNVPAPSNPLAAQTWWRV